MSDELNGTDRAVEPEPGGERSSRSVRRSARSAVRGIGAPVRSFFNQHFEMVKGELRGTSASTNARLAEIGNVVAETNIHQAKVIAGLRRDVSDLIEQVDRLNELNQLLLDAVAGLTPVIGVGDDDRADSASDDATSARA